MNIDTTHLVDYSEADAEQILDRVDPDKQDKEELEQVLDLLLVQRLDLKTNKKQYSKGIATRITDYFNIFFTIGDRFKGLTQEERNEELEQQQEYSKLANAYVHLIREIENIDKDQGLYVSDYERNAWRFNYVLKSIRYAELQETQGLEIDQEYSLLKNFTEPDFDGMDATRDRFIYNQVKTQANVNLMYFLAEYTGLYDFIYMARRFELDLSITDRLELEGIAVEQIFNDKILKDVTDADALEDLTDKYSTLFVIPRLRHIKIHNEDYERIKNKYIELPLLDLAQQLNKITRDFTKAIDTGGAYDDRQR